jgi:hypothetical protein
MACEPDVAQAMFERDILPELQRGRQFRLYRDVPGFMGFSDGIVDIDRVFEPVQAAGPVDARRREEGTPGRNGGSSAGAHGGQRPGRSAGVLAPNVVRRRPWLYVTLRRLSSKRIKVRFTEQPTGTLVRIRGSAGRATARGLNRLGEPGRWPASAEPLRS